MHACSDEEDLDVQRASDLTDTLLTVMACMDGPSKVNQRKVGVCWRSGEEARNGHGDTGDFQVWSRGHSRILADTNCVPGRGRKYYAYGSDHPLCL